MNRRRLLCGLGAVLVLTAGIARGQRQAARIAVLFGGTEASAGYLLEAFRKGMRDQGHGDDTIVYDAVYAGGQPEGADELIQKMLARKPEIIVVSSPQLIRTLLNLSRSIPIVMANTSNVVSNKFVASLARPGGNVTGVTTLYEELLPKIAEILHAFLPKAVRIGVLVNENNPSHKVFWENSELGLRTLGKTPMRLAAGKPEEFEAVFASLRKSRAGLDRRRRYDFLRAP